MPRSDITENAYSYDEIEQNAKVITKSGKAVVGTYKGVKKGVKGAKKAIKKVSMVAKAVKSVMIGVTSLLGTIPTVVIIIFIVVPFAITMVFTQQHYLTVENLLRQQSEIYYISAINKHKRSVVDYLNDNYAVDFFTSDISDIASPSDNQWTLLEESKDEDKIEYHVSIKFVPGVDRAAPLIASYILAVNNVIAQFDEKVVAGDFSDYELQNYDEIYKSPYEDQDIDYQEQAFDESCEIPMDYDLNLDMKDQLEEYECKPSNEMIEYIEDPDTDENMFPTSPKLITSVRSYFDEYGLYYAGGKNSWQVYESEPYEIEKEIEIPNEQPLPETPDGNHPTQPPESEDYIPPTITKIIKVKVIDVSVKIPVFYDLSSYKQEELSNIKDFLVLYGRKDEDPDTGLGMSVDNADRQLQSMINEYFDQTLDYYEVSDYYRYPYSEFGIYTSPSGINPDRANGNPGYEGELGDADFIEDPSFGTWSDYALGTVSKGNEWNVDLITRYKNVVWTHCHKTIPSGLKFSCVTLARAWFKDHYGIDWVHGNGSEVVDNLISEHGDRFEYGRSPAPGAIFSIPGTGDNRFGHVGCIDAVSENTITFTDGNLEPIRGKETNGVRVMMEVSKSRFYEMYPGVEFANPKQ